MFNKKVSYTFPEYAQILREKEAMKQLGLNERISGVILCNKKLKKIVTFALAMVFSSQKAYAAGDKAKDAMDRLDEGGWIILMIIRRAGYWICLILCIVEILKCLANGDLKSIGRSVGKYLIAFGILYALPWLFDIIAECFA
jgi:hypothetical protein